MSELRLFEVDDGVLYWLGATSAKEAMERYQSWVPDAYGEDEVSVREVGAEQAEVLSYVDEGGKRLRSMGEQLRIQGRDMFACSEQ